LKEETMTAAPLVTQSSNREKWAWYLYDFGNSAYAAVVLLAVYSAYFEGTVVQGENGTQLWSLAVSIAMVIVAIISPVLGIMADFSGRKKLALLVMTSLSILFTAGLFFVRAGDVVMGMVFFIIAEVGYRAGQVFYNSLLPEIATQAEISSVSGKGWAIGSLGGIICLVIVLVMIQTATPETRGLMVSLSFLLTAVFFLLSVLPLVFWVKEKKQPTPLPAGQNYFSVAFKQLAKTLATFFNFRASPYKEFRKFILSFLIYNDGIIAVLDFAAIIGAILYGMKQEQLIIFMIIVQITNVLGAYIYGIIGERYSFRQSLLWSLVLMIASVLAINFIDGINGFFVIGAVAGFAMAGVQSVSRAMIGGFAPPGQSAEFYGLFSFAGRTSSFIGPAIFGLVVGISETTFGVAEVLAHKYAIGSIAVFLVVGLILFLRVDEKEGRKIALGVATAPAAD
jgi:UMF1 family MFS transporter